MNWFCRGCCNVISSLSNINPSICSQSHLHDLPREDDGTRGPQHPHLLCQWLPSACSRNHLDQERAVGQLVNQSEVSQTQYYSNSDFSFRISSYLTITPQEGDIYSCSVGHFSLKMPLNKFWGRSTIKRWVSGCKSNRGGVFWLFNNHSFTWALGPKLISSVLAHIGIRIHDPQRMSPRDFSCSTIMRLAFYLFFLAKCLDNCWTDFHEMHTFMATSGWTIITLVIPQSFSSRAIIRWKGIDYIF